MHKFFMIVALMFVISSTCAYAGDTNHDGYETILFPIAFPGTSSDTVPGLLGTQWQGEIWVHNASAATVFSQPTAPCQFEQCVGPVSPQFTGRFIPGIWPGGGRPLLISPLARDAASLTFSNRIFEVTRHAQPQGFQVPVVREGDFLNGPSDYLGIPGGAGVRTTLRIYDPRRVSGTSVQVQLIDDKNTIVRGTVVTTTFSDGTPFDVVQPGYASIDVGAVFPEVQSLPRYQLRLIPSRPGDEYWAMASVTDNDTQQVLIITPQ